MPRHHRKKNRHRFVYLIRHGDYEKSPEHFGGVLTPRGEEQTRHLIDPMSKIPVDAIYSSKMHRAVQTAQILRDGAFPELEIQQTPWLNERLFPGYFTGEDADVEKDQKAREILEKCWSRFFRPSRSERHDVLVCHGNVIRAILTRVLGAPLEHWFRAGIANCGITQLVSIDAETTRLISFNERGHLPYRLRYIGSGK